MILEVLKDSMEEFSSENLPMLELQVLEFQLLLEEQLEVSSFHI